MSVSLSYETVVDVLLSRVPAFAATRLQDDAYISHDDKNPYLVFGDLGRFLRERLTARHSGSGDDTILLSSFGLLDEMLNSNDAQLMNLAQLGVFEDLASTPDLLSAAKNYLSNDAKSILEFWLRKWLA